MRRLFASIAIIGAASLGIAVPIATAATGSASIPAKYYLALGDSLAQGVQPNSAGASVETDQGYANDLLAYYKAYFPGSYQLEDLGCPGETSTSMLTGTGSPCTYPQGSQLAAALAFIHAHPGKIALITVDIGANDVDGCASSSSIDQACIASGFSSVQTNLPKILSALRSAAGAQTVIAGMNLYDPFLADYLTGAAGQAVAQESISLASSLNSMLSASFNAYKMPVADVASAFSTTDSTDTAQLPGVGTVPLNVARICEWTWMCAPAPAGPNIHANATGYQQIANAFEAVIGRLHA